ncbi:MAG: DUF3267 domain-containing protein [Bacteroidetes bacterium]|nr:DUF3267 domain-containing protein [Bacteroidota bacterium]
MNWKPEVLEENGYALFETLPHAELLGFLKKHKSIKNRYSYAFLIFNLLFFLLGVSYSYWLVRTEQMRFGDVFSYLSYGISISILLIPFHEYLHVLAYRSQGAKQTSLSANWKRFYFMALAHRFVANQKEFIIVALTPFAVITSLALLGLLLGDSTFKLVFLGLLIVHTAMCSGDFSLLKFLEYHKKDEVLTYDDAENKISYFFRRRMN